MTRQYTMNETQNMVLTPDGKSSAGLVQGPQENGQWTLRIAVRDAATGDAREFAFDTRPGSMDPAQATVMALNDHQFLVLPGRGVDSQDAAFSAPIWAVDVAGAQDIAGRSNAEALLAKAPTKVPFQDASAALRSFGLLEAEVAATQVGATSGLTASSGSLVSSSIGGAPAGIQYDPEFLARGETYLPREESESDNLMGFFTGLDLGLPVLGRLARDPAAMPGMGGLVVVVLGAIALSRMVRRRPLPFRRY